MPTSPPTSTATGPRCLGPRPADGALVHRRDLRTHACAGRLLRRDRRPARRQGVPLPRSAGQGPGTCGAGQDRHRPVTAAGVRQPGARLCTGRRGRCDGQGGNPPGGPARPTSAITCSPDQASPADPLGARSRRRSAPGARPPPPAPSIAAPTRPNGSSRSVGHALRRGDRPEAGDESVDQERRQDVAVLLGHGRAMGGRQDRAGARSYEIRTLSQRDRKRTGGPILARHDASARSSSSRPSSPSRAAAGHRGARSSPAASPTRAGRATCRCPPATPAVRAR